LNLNKRSVLAILTMHTYFRLRVRKLLRYELTGLNTIVFTAKLTKSRVDDTAWHCLILPRLLTVIDWPLKLNGRRGYSWRREGGRRVPMKKRVEEVPAGGTRPRSRLVILVATPTPPWRRSFSLFDFRPPRIASHRCATCPRGNGPRSKGTTPGLWNSTFAVEDVNRLWNRVVGRWLYISFYRVGSHKTGYSREYPQV